MNMVSSCTSKQSPDSMDLDAINPDIMTQEDKKLLNDYHAKVYEVIAPYLNEEEQEWLKKYTRAI